LTGDRNNAQNGANQYFSPISTVAISGGAIIVIKAETTAKYWILTRATRYAVTMLTAMPITT
jgi:hypothetical protein